MRISSLLCVKFEPVVQIINHCMFYTSYFTLLLCFESLPDLCCCIFSSNGIKEAVNYQTLSTKDLAKSVLSEGGWSNLLCSGKEAQQHSVDVALLFVGRELQSWDSSGAKHVDSSVVDFLKVSFAGANFTLAFPYIAASQEEEAVESSLISEFAETCGHNLAGKVSFMESCSLDGGNYEKLSDIKTFHDYLVSRMEKRQKGQAYLAVFCQGSSHSESQILSELISSMLQSGARYTVLYVSDPLRPVQYPSYREVERFLAESASGNGSFNSTSCDGVCLVKSSLLEGILVVSHAPFLLVYDQDYEVGLGPWALPNQTITIEDIFVLSYLLRSTLQLGHKMGHEDFVTIASIQSSYLVQSNNWAFHWLPPLALLHSIHQ
ncbi:hypothetical protein RHGRI_038232 [Rhododendron griersonianum]|uniref:Uncharacterized protein n=1 Tax=Rhododendron griersonianum TaxID=479676 RepID=A0AAV6I0Q9_9ERIC|nr:hypothetical protein RHGRI_038232 [Rhododendron griersonianum]